MGPPRLFAGVTAGPTQGCGRVRATGLLGWAGGHEARFIESRRVGDRARRLLLAARRGMATCAGHLSPSHRTPAGFGGDWLWVTKFEGKTGLCPHSRV
jgi:hypothetical protein